MKTRDLFPFLSVLFLASGVPAEEKRFEPAKHFPLECLAYLEVPSGGGLAAALADTLIGRIVVDPEVRAALGRTPQFLRGVIRDTSEPLIEATGRDPLDLLQLLRNGLAVSVTGIDPVSKVSLVAALELGTDREAILEVVSRISAQLVKEGGAELPTLEVGKRKATVWPLLGGLSRLHHLVLGTHLVFASSPDVMKAVVEAFDGPGAPDFSLSANPRYAEAEKALALKERRLLFFLNLEALRGFVMPFLLHNEGSKDLVQALRSSGFLSVTTVGFSLGTRGGGLESRWLLGTGERAQGLLGDLVAALEAPGDPTAALKLVPAASSQVSSVAVNGGKVFRALHAFIEKGLPEELKVEAQELIRKMEESSGLSLEKDLFSLGRIDLHSFVVTPPAGGLIPDCLAVVRSEELAPYRAVLLKVARALKKEPREIPGPAAGAGTPVRAISYLRVGSVFTRLAGLEEPPPPEGFLYAAVQPPIALAEAELAGGWTVISSSPQPVWRYLLKPAAGSAAFEAVAASLRAEPPGAKGYCVVRAGTSILPIYNVLATLAEALGSAFSSHLTAFEVDLARLPPGEKFLGSLKDQLLRFEAGPQGLVLHCRPLAARTGP